MELIDAYMEYRRWLRAKSKAIFRDWEREKKELKEKTVRLIEDEVEETKGRLIRELEGYK